MIPLAPENPGYKEIKKTGEFVLPGFGKLVQQKRKASSNK